MDQQALADLETKIKSQKYLDREDLLSFLKLIPTNDAKTIIELVEEWIRKMDADPGFDGVNFPQGDIDAIVSDLDSYGRISPELLYSFKQKSPKVPPTS